MSDYEIYVFLLCLVVFVLLTSLSIFCVTIIAKQSFRLIKGGLDDEKIIDEYKKKKENSKKIKYSKLADTIFSTVVCLIFAVTFLGSVVIQSLEGSCCGALPTYRVVQTGSMSYKHEKNTYLKLDNVNNQIQTFDLIKTEKLPDEMDLELYDIVVYQVDDIILVHRIVSIEEPNEFHPDRRYFKLQGDAVEAPDRYPVVYDQMLAIYNGERIPFLGSFVLFMQSFAGWLCMLLIVAAMVITPILEKKLILAKEERVRILDPTLLEKDKDVIKKNKKQAKKEQKDD